MLKLLALDKEDLEVISAHLQDAVLMVGDLAWLPAQKRFAAVVNRFDWEADCRSATTGSKDHKRGKDAFQRRRTALRFDRVLAAQTQNINLQNKRAVLSLLAIQFESSGGPDTGAADGNETAGREPGGYVLLTFAGGGAIRLEVECIEAELRDLGAAWATKNRPQHPEAQSGLAPEAKES